jgi:hypothetical protein
LGLQGLACLAACSNSLRKGCLTCFKREALALTARAITTAEGKQQSQQLQAVVWLLHQVPAAATAFLSDLLIRLRYVPLQSAKALVAAGVRITYAQLLAAAYSMVPGVGVWVQAQHDLGVQTDIPCAAVEICCVQVRVSGCHGIVHCFQCSHVTDFSQQQLLYACAV